MRENRIVLEDHADVSLIWRQVVDHPVIKFNLSTFNGVESGNHS